jgi:phage host-nuclease inhibitor protein Gam
MTSLARISRPARTLPLDRHEVGRLIERLGVIRVMCQQHDAQCADDITQIKSFHASVVSELETEATALIILVQSYCEAHRLTLTDGGRVKTARFPGGSVGWRKCAPSISIEDAGLVLDELRKVGLREFIRTKESVDKDALLKAPAVAATIEGVTVLAGGEDFFIKTLA